MQRRRPYPVNPEYKPAAAANEAMYQDEQQPLYDQQPIDYPYQYPYSYPFLTRVQYYVQSQLQDASYPVIFLVIFIFLGVLALIGYFVYSCLTNSSAGGRARKSIEDVWTRKAKPIMKKKLKNKKSLARRVGNALISDNHSMKSDDYEDFLRYKSKMLKYRQMAAQCKKQIQQNKLKNQNLINYRLLNADSADDYRKMTEEQISKLARKEKSNCLIDLEGIDDAYDKYRKEEPRRHLDVNYSDSRAILSSE